MRRHTVGQEFGGARIEFTRVFEAFQLQKKIRLAQRQRAHARESRRCVIIRTQKRVVLSQAIKKLVEIIVRGEVQRIARDGAAIALHGLVHAPHGL